MQQPTYDALPEDVKEAAKGVIIDPTVRARVRKKRERQNRKAGRARR